MLFDQLREACNLAFLDGENITVILNGMAYIVQMNPVTGVLRCYLLASPTTTPELTELDAPLAVALAFDRRPRRSMQDHFLPTTTTPEQLAAGQHEELGDFFGARYKLDSAERDDESRAVVQLSREGEVRDGPHQRLVRVVKRLVFPADEPWVEARYEVVNRYAGACHRPAGGGACPISLEHHHVPRYRSCSRPAEARLRHR